MEAYGAMTHSKPWVEERGCRCCEWGLHDAAADCRLEGGVLRDGEAGEEAVGFEISDLRLVNLSSKYTNADGSARFTWRK